MGQFLWWAWLLGAPRSKVERAGWNWNLKLHSTFLVPDLVSRLFSWMVLLVDLRAAAMRIQTLMKTAQKYVCSRIVWLATPPVEGRGVLWWLGCNHRTADQYSKGEDLHY